MSDKKGPDFDIEQRISFLKRISFFSDFDDHEMRQFLSVSKWLKVPPESVIIKEDTVERVFYILVKGKVSVFKKIDDQGSTIELTTLATGDCFGEMSLVAETRRTAGVKTLSESYILMVDPDIINASNVFLQLKFYKRFCDILVSRLIMANERVKSREAKGGGPSLSTPTLAKEPESNEGPKEYREPQRRPTENRGMTATAVAGLPPMPNSEERIPRSKLQRLISPQQNLPVNPAVIARIKSFMTSEGTTNTRLLAELISLDPVLCARILQVANSYYFKRTSTVLSVPHAMVTLGVEHILKIVSETMDAGSSVPAFSGHEEIAKKFWRHAIIVGKIAELLRDIIRINVHVDLYLAGLLHDLGMLALDNLKPAFYPQLLRPDCPWRNQLEQAESDLVGVDHAQAGRWLAEALGLPEPYPYIIGSHHTPEKCRDNQLPVAIVCLADLFTASQDFTVGNQPPETRDILRSHAWVLIKEQHRPFLEVNVPDFITSFSQELTRQWGYITAVLPVE